jgi:hypothetical protein
MSKLLWHTVTISIPDKMVIKTKTGKTSLKQTLTELNSLVKAGGYPAIKLVNSNDNKVHVIDEGEPEFLKPKKVKIPKDINEIDIIDPTNKRPKKSMMYNKKLKPIFDIKDINSFKSTNLLRLALIDYYKDEKEEDLILNKNISRDELLKLIKKFPLSLNDLAFYYNQNIDLQIYLHPTDNLYNETIKTFYIKPLPKYLQPDEKPEKKIRYKPEIELDPNPEKPRSGSKSLRDEPKKVRKTKPKKEIIDDEEKPQKKIKDEKPQKKIKEEKPKKIKEEKPKKIKEEKPKEEKSKEDIFKSLKLFQNALYIYFDKEGNSIVNMLDFKTASNEDLHDLIKIHKVPIEEVIKIHDNLIYKEIYNNPTKTDYINKLKLLIINKDEDED